MRVAHEYAGLILAILFFWLLVTPALAWEFSMKVDFVWEYYAYGQLGAQGFFGRYDTDNSDASLTYGGTRGSGASMNGWLGNQIGQISSGSDMAQVRFFMLMHPEIRLNPALRIRGAYRIGSWANPGANTSEGALVRSEYIESMSFGVQRSFSPGYWNTLWASAHTPWGIVVLGKRPGPLGIGLMFDAEDNADSGGVVLMTNYGPFRVGLGSLRTSLPVPNILHRPTRIAYYGPIRRASSRMTRVLCLSEEASGTFGIERDRNHRHFRAPRTRWLQPVVLASSRQIRTFISP